MYHDDKLLTSENGDLWEWVGGARLARWAGAEDGHRQEHVQGDLQAGDRCSANLAQLSQKLLRDVEVAWIACIHVVCKPENVLLGLTPLTGQKTPPNRLLGEETIASPGRHGKELREKRT